MNILKQFYYSFTSPKKMAIFRFQGIGKTILYVFFLMFISTISTGVILANDIHKWTVELKDKIIPTMPEFQIENGQLQSDYNQTYTYKGDNEIVFIFDPTGAVKVSDVKGQDTLALLEKEIIMNLHGEKQSISYSSFNDVQLSKGDLNRFIEYISSLLFIIVPVLYSFIYLLLTAFKFIGITALALIGYAFKSKKFPKLQYKHFWIISAYAVTIPTIFFSITDTLRISVPVPLTIYWGSAILILLLALNEIPTPASSKAKE